VRALPGLAALLLAGCATGVPVERQVVVPGDRFQAVQGEAAFLVRTFLAPEGDVRREVVGADCELTSSLYTATLVTPARLVVPNFGPQSPELNVACRADGLSGAGRIEIITRWREPPGYWGYPGFGLYPNYPWGWGAYGPGYPVSDYPNLNITLR
jgi:hypothetical protein